MQTTTLCYSHAQEGRRWPIVTMMPIRIHDRMHRLRQGRQSPASAK